MAAAGFRQVRPCLADVRQRALELAPLRGLRYEVAARTCVRLRRETRLQLSVMRQVLHALCDSPVASREWGRRGLPPAPYSLFSTPYCP